MLLLLYFNFPIIKKKKNVVIHESGQVEDRHQNGPKPKSQYQNQRVWCKIGGPLRGKWPQHVLGLLRQD